MTEFYTDPLVTLLHGDCLEVMATLPADSVDAVVTDPPYGLEFMGKDWDRFGATIEHPDDGEGPWGRTKRVRYGNGPGQFQAWCERWGAEALRVTKPGGYLLAFGGTRTHHRLVCALEDAGWIIRDELDWIYASGFPKGKANLKPAHEPIVLARKPGPLRPLAIDESRIGTSKDVPASPAIVPESERGLGYGYGPRDPAQNGFNPNVGRWPSNVLLSDPELFDKPNPYVVGSGATLGVSAGSTTGEWGRHGIYGKANGYDEPRDVGYGDSGGYSRFFIVPKADRAERERGLADRPKSQAMIPGTGTQKQCGKCGEKWITDGLPRCGHGREFMIYIPQANHPRANVHPTVKPIDLMRHLVKLVTPLNGVVLDPFLGSGTTCLAASELGVRSIGIEREAEYLEIAKGRLIATPMGLGLDVPIVQPAKRMSPGHTPDYRSPHAVDGWGFSTGTSDPEEVA